jgi:hypothetical protein
MIRANGSGDKAFCCDINLITEFVKQRLKTKGIGINRIEGISPNGEFLLNYAKYHLDHGKGATSSTIQLNEITIFGANSSQASARIRFVFPSGEYKTRDFKDENQLGRIFNDIFSSVGFISADENSQSALWMRLHELTVDAEMLAAER